MTLYQGIVTFSVAWWLILFMVLPWGAQPSDAPPPGTVPSAPAKPRLLLKFAVTTVLALLATFAIKLLVESDLFSLRPPPPG
jgi:predicted secreted protein